MQNKDKQLVCSFFFNLYTKKPEQRTLTWQDLIERFTKGPWPEKRGPLWSPTSYKDDATRSTDGVEAFYCFPLDFDDGVEPGSLTPRWDTLGLAYLIHSSFHNQRDKYKDGKLQAPACSRWRAVFLLAEPATPDNWPETYTRIATWLADDHWDKSCTTAERFYYEPAAAPDAERFAYAHDGRPLDLDEAPDLPEPPKGKMPRFSPPASGGPTERPGDDYSQRGDHRAVLTDAGWEYVANRGDNEYWRRPGKPHGTSASWHISRRVFYCFTSSAPSLEPNHAYSLFALRAALEGWDYSDLARQLRQEGYGGGDTKNRAPGLDEEEDPQGDDALNELRKLAPDRAQELVQSRAAKLLARFGIAGVLRREVPDDPSETRYIVELVGGHCTEPLTYPRIANWYNYETALVHATGELLPIEFSTLEKKKRTAEWRRVVRTLLNVARVEQLDAEAGEAGAIREAVCAYLAVARSEWDESLEPAEAPFPFVAPHYANGPPCTWLRLASLMTHVRQAEPGASRPVTVQTLKDLGGRKADRPSLPTRDRDGQVRLRPVRGRVWLVPVPMDEKDDAEMGSDESVESVA